MPVIKAAPSVDRQTHFDQQSEFKYVFNTEKVPAAMVDLTKNTFQNRHSKHQQNCTVSHVSGFKFVKQNSTAPVLYIHIQMFSEKP